MTNQKYQCFISQLFTCTVLRRLNCCIVGKSGRPMLCHSWYGLLTLLSMRYVTYTRPGEPTERGGALDEQLTHTETSLPDGELANVPVCAASPLSETVTSSAPVELLLSSLL